MAQRQETFGYHNGTLGCYGLETGDQLHSFLILGLQVQSMGGQFSMLESVAPQLQGLESQMKDLGKQLPSRLINPQRTKEKVFEHEKCLNISLQDNLLIIKVCVCVVLRLQANEMRCFGIIVL